MIRKRMLGIPRGVHYPQLPGAASSGRVPGAPTRELPLPTSAAWIRSSPRRRTRGSGCPEEEGIRGDPESHAATLSPRLFYLSRPCT